MSAFKEIEDALRKLSPEEMQHVQDFLEDLIEAQLEFTGLPLQI
jgi:hypothetical protein